MRLRMHVGRRFCRVLLCGGGRIGREELNQARLRQHEAAFDARASQLKARVRREDNCAHKDAAATISAWWENSDRRTK